MKGHSIGLTSQPTKNLTKPLSKKPAVQSLFYCCFSFFSLITYYQYYGFFQKALLLRSIECHPPCQMYSWKKLSRLSLGCWHLARKHTSATRILTRKRKKHLNRRSSRKRPLGERRYFSLTHTACNLKTPPDIRNGVADVGGNKQCWHLLVYIESLEKVASLVFVHHIYNLTYAIPLHEYTVFILRPFDKWWVALSYSCQVA